MSVGRFFKGVVRRIVYGPGHASKAPGYIDRASAEARATRSEQASTNTPLDTLTTQSSPEINAGAPSLAVETPIEPQVAETPTATLQSEFAEPVQSMTSHEEVVETAHGTVDAAPVAFADAPAVTTLETPTSSFESNVEAAHFEAAQQLETPVTPEMATSSEPQTPDFLTSSPAEQQPTSPEFSPEPSMEETSSTHMTMEPQLETQVTPEMATPEAIEPGQPLSEPGETSSLFSAPVAEQRVVEQPVAEQPAEGSAPAAMATALAGAAVATAAASLSPFFVESKSELVENQSESVKPGLGLDSVMAASIHETGKDTSPLGHVANIVHSSKIGVVSHKKACCPSTTLSNIVSTSYGELAKKVSPAFSSLKTGEVGLLTEVRDHALKSVKSF